MTMAAFAQNSRWLPIITNHIQSVLPMEKSAHVIVRRTTINRLATVARITTQISTNTLHHEDRGNPRKPSHPIFDRPSHPII